MKHRKLAYFNCTGELIIDLIKKHTDLAADAELIKVELNPTATYFHDNINQHLIRFYVCSDTYQELMEGELVYQITPIGENR